MSHKVKRRSQRTLHSAEAAAHIEKRLGIREPTRMETGVNHDRIGADAQRIAGAHGTAFARQPCQPRPNAAIAQQKIGANKEGDSDLTDKTVHHDRALDALERCVRELATLVGEAERAVARQVEKLRGERERARGTRLNMGR